MELNGQDEVKVEVDAYVRLRIADAAIAIAAQDIGEITDLGSIVPLPRAPKHVLGLARVRERALPIVAMNVLANIGEPDDLSRMVIIERDGMRVGLACDEVMGICDIPRGVPSPLEKTRNLPAFLTHEHHDARGPVLLLDAKSFLEAARTRKR